MANKKIRKWTNLTSGQQTKLLNQFDKIRGARHKATGKEYSGGKGLKMAGYGIKGFKGWLGAKGINYSGNSMPTKLRRLKGY